LANPNHSKYNCEVEYESEIELDNGTTDSETADQRGVSPAPNLH
jgi:hypothetical protein